MQRFNKDTKVEGTRPNQPIHCGEMFTEGRNLALNPVSIKSQHYDRRLS